MWNDTHNIVVVYDSSPKKRPIDIFVEELTEATPSANEEWGRFVVTDPSGFDLLNQKLREVFNGGEK